MRNISRILVTTDLSPASEIALPWAEIFAEKFQASMMLLCVIDPHLADSHDYYARSQATDFDIEKTELRASKKMEKMVHERLMTHEMDVRTVRNAAAHEGILRFAEKGMFDLIVMATHGYTGFDHVLLGSVTERVVRQSVCPVLCIHGGPDPYMDEIDVRRILCSTDFSRRAQEGVDAGMLLAKKFNADLDVVHVTEETHGGYGVYAHAYREEDDQKLWEDNLDDAVKGSGEISVRKHLKHGSVSVCINELADKSPDELIVMATHGCDSLSDYLIGGNTEQVIRHSHHPVLVCPCPAKPQQVEAVPA